MNDPIITFVAGLGLGLLGGVSSGGAIVEEVWQVETVERDLAQYCPKTGHWAWKGECKDG